jgi:hypothetical protein
MIPLSDTRWKTFEGGYRIPYNVSVPLAKLELTNDSKEIDLIFAELWEELYHQGDVGMASYLSTPHILRIAIEKMLINFNVFALVASIEIARGKNNPQLAMEYENWYLTALRNDIPALVAIALTQPWDMTLSSAIFSALAVSKGHVELADATSKMEDLEIVNEFLENF